MEINDLPKTAEVEVDIDPHTFEPILRVPVLNLEVRGKNSREALLNLRSRLQELYI